MHAMTIVYKDLNTPPTERTETFYFDLTEEELLEMEISSEGGLDQIYNDIIASNDNAEIYGKFKELILKAYGEKSPDGRFFDKSPELSRRFSRHAAFSKIIMTLATNEELGGEFVTNLIPKAEDMEMVKAAERARAAQADPQDRRQKQRVTAGVGLTIAPPISPVTTEPIVFERPLNDYTALEIMNFDPERATEFKRQWAETFGS